MKLSLCYDPNRPKSDVLPRRTTIGQAPDGGRRRPRGRRHNLHEQSSLLKRTRVKGACLWAVVLHDFRCPARRRRRSALGAHLHRPASPAGVQPRAHRTGPIHRFRGRVAPLPSLFPAGTAKVHPSGRHRGVPTSLLRKRRLLLSSHDLHPSRGGAACGDVHGRDSRARRHRLEHPLSA